MKKFDVAYSALPPKLRSEVKNKITSQVFMVNNQQTFYNKKNGKENITDYEWDKIMDVFAEYRIDATTGKITEPCKIH
jgi:hypothetical protein